MGHNSLPKLFSLSFLLTTVGPRSQIWNCYLQYTWFTGSKWLNWIKNLSISSRSKSKYYFSSRLKCMFPIFGSWKRFPCIVHEPLGLERPNGISQLPRRAMPGMAMLLSSAFFLRANYFCRAMEYNFLCHLAIVLLVTCNGFTKFGCVKIYKKGYYDGLIIYINIYTLILDQF